MRPVRSHFLNLSMVDPQGFGVERLEQGQVEQELLFGRLKPVDTGYSCELRCMDGTRQFFSMRLLTGYPTNRDKRMFSRGMSTGSTAHLESEKLR